MKSMAYSLTFQNPEDSLTDEEVARYMEKIQASLEEKVNAESALICRSKQLRHALSCFFMLIKKESGTEIGNSLEFDFVVPPPHS